MECRPNLADAQTMASRVAELYRGCLATSDPDAIARFDDELCDIAIFLELSYYSENRPLATFCREQVERVGKRVNAIRSLEDELRGCEHINIAEVEGRLVTMEDLFDIISDRRPVFRFHLGVRDVATGTLSICAPRKWEWKQDY